MPLLRHSLVFLAMAAIPAMGQEPSNTAPGTSPAAVSTATATVPDKIMHIGGNVKAPVVLSIATPTFTQEAKKAKFSGTVTLYLLVEKDGTPSHIRVVKGVGMGLDEKAVEAVRQYKFKPATFMGRPVTVDLYVEVNFQIV
jgi:TonB family protein